MVFNVRLAKIPILTGHRLDFPRGSGLESVTRDCCLYQLSAYGIEAKNPSTTSFEQYVPLSESGAGDSKYGISCSSLH